ncbi:protein efr3 [Aspergillus egyptiacus]|nr:protein efr3 [Aspergillus egyptiacus]
MTIEAVRQSCRPKHQILVLKCYPQYQKGVQDVKPNPSELSYLLYYVSTRRSKLPKVSAFLEKRAARDVWRRKMGNVQVTLQILSALIEKVPRDLPIFARSVLTIIETVQQSRDISMVEDSITTFETFCQHQDMAALSAEQDFANQYRQVVRTYADFAHPETPSQTDVAPSSPHSIRWKNAGLRAIKGVVSSEAGLAADGEDSARIILPVILENLYNGDDSLIASLEHKLRESEQHQPDQAARRRYSAVTVQTVDTAEGDPALAAQEVAEVDKKAELDMRLLALRCLEQIIVNGSSRGQIRVTTKVVLDFILRKEHLNSSQPPPNADVNNWATSLIELVAKWCPVQARFIISTTAMEVLFEIPAKEETLDKAFTIIYMIDWLLKSPVNMVGLSVIDILLGLMRYMSRVVSPTSSADDQAAEKEKAQDVNAELSPKRKGLLLLLQKTIGDLTTHIYYGDQVVDMLRAILTRIRPVHYQDQPGPALLPDQTNGNSEANSTSFLSTSVKVCALKAIKNILLVANSQRPTASAGVESRNPVGIHVWEGTHWLLQDPEKEVRYAYVDALLYWLKLETSKNDLRLKDRSHRASVSSPRRDLSDTAERAAKRATGAQQREKAMVVAQSNFLRLLHLAIYELALQRSSEETEIRVLHLLLVSLVENLGINVVRFGLPMMLRLQDDLEGLSSPAAKVNVGSLVYGYLWALSETFELDTYHVGKEIFTEIERRKSQGIWLESINFSLTSLDSIIQDHDRHAVNHNVKDTDKLTPFKNGVEELVRLIEEAYNQPMLTHSPPSSPGLNLGKPVMAGHASSNPHQGELLPSSVRDQILSPWSKALCLEAAERDKTEALSLSGSRAGTLPVRGNGYFNGTRGSSLSTNSPSAHGAAGLQNARRMSMPEKRATPGLSSSRDSPVHVNALRRVLSVNVPDRDQRLSPLRGRLHASKGSTVSSSSESMVSGFSNSDFDGDGGSIRPQSASDTNEPGGDGAETPRAPMSNGSQSSQPPSISRTSSYSIPPVPPIPHDISIPGGYPNGSQRSLASSDRPSTAPASRRPSINGKPAGPNDSKTLNRHKTRSFVGLSNGNAPGVAINGKSSGTQMYGLHHVEDTPQRRDVQKLLDGFLSPSDAETIRPSRTASRFAGRRSATGGIGRPPY